jgi:hypothetical protein
MISSRLCHHPGQITSTIICLIFLKAYNFQIDPNFLDSMTIKSISTRVPPVQFDTKPPCFFQENDDNLQTIQSKQPFPYKK